MHRFRIWAYVIFLSTFFLAGCGDDTTTSSSQDGLSWPLYADTMNLAILVSDYLSYGFEKGTLDYYPPCSSCDLDSLPFAITLRSAGDFGDITFAYTSTGDTLFRGTIIWLGTGEIEFPAAFLPASQFTTLPMLPRMPLSVEYFNIYPVMERYAFRAKADSAWTRVRTLDIVADFARSNYRVGIYLYAPRVGLFDPSAAKWIIFLYRGKL